MPPAPSTNEARQRAAITIQRAWRDRGKPKKKKKKKNSVRWPTIFELKEMYLDREAMAAGAADSEMYTDAAIKEREKLRRHPAVVAALEDAWAALVPEGSEGMDEQMASRSGARTPD